MEDDDNTDLEQQRSSAWALKTIDQEVDAFNRACKSHTSARDRT